MIRSNVSGRGEIFACLEWLLKSIIKPVLRHMKAHVGITPEPLEHFNKPSIAERKGKIPVSFDFVSLYTNIPVKETVDTTLQYINKYNIDLHNREAIHILQFLSLLLKKKCSNTLVWLRYANQRFGHGQPNKWNVGDLVMDRFEHTYIYRNLKPESLIYVRYIYDTGTIVNDANEAGQTLRYFNEQHPTIKFELKLPDESGFLPI